MWEKAGVAVLDVNTRHIRPKLAPCGPPWNHMATAIVSTTAWLFTLNKVAYFT
jgi:hypothetical protein